jgi:SAM-dependent methyltransferase
LTGIELSPRMLEIGRRRAEELGRDVDLRIGDAQALEFEDQSFDTVIIMFGLCTIPDDRAAATEAHRVLRPGGRLVLLEHRARSARALVQRQSEGAPLRLPRRLRGVRVGGMPRFARLPLVRARVERVLLRACDLRTTITVDAERREPSRPRRITVHCC